MIIQWTLGYLDLDYPAFQLSIMHGKLIHIGCALIRGFASSNIYPDFSFISSQEWSRS